MICMILLASVAAQDYYEPVTKAKRELAALGASREEVHGRIRGISDAIAKDSQGFYKRHAADCQVTAKNPDGSVKFVYVPARAWLAQRKQFDLKITEKEVELLEVYDAVLRELTELEGHLRKRQAVWETSLGRLDKVETDFKDLEAEWRRATLMAGWTFVNEVVPLMGKGLNKVGVRLKRPPAGSFFSKVSLADRNRLEKSIEKLQTASSAAIHATQALLAGFDAAKARAADECAQKIFDAGYELSEVGADILKEVAIGATKAELEEFEQVRAAVAAFVSIVKFGAGAATGGFDDKAKAAAGDAFVSVMKFVGEFEPTTKVIMMSYGTLMAGGEAGIGAYTWWGVAKNADEHRKNLERARSTLESVRKELQSVSARLAEVRRDREPLARKLGR